MSQQPPTKPKRSARGERGAQALARWRAEQRAKGLPVNPRAGGVTNPLTRKVRQSVMRVYDEIGGDEAFAEWARKNRSAFYQLMARLAPKEREANALGSGITINIGSSDDLRPEIDVTPTVKVSGADQPSE